MVWVLLPNRDANMKGLAGNLLVAAMFKVDRDRIVDDRVQTLPLGRLVLAVKPEP